MKDDLNDQVGVLGCLTPYSTLDQIASILVTLTLAQLIKFFMVV